MLPGYMNIKCYIYWPNFITRLWLLSKLNGFFICNTFTRTPDWNWQKIQKTSGNTLRLNVWHSHSSSTLSIKKNDWTYSKNKQKNKCVCIHETIRLIIMKIKMKMKKRIRHKYYINRPRSRHGHKYNKYKKFLNMMMLACIKQHLSNI